MSNTIKAAILSLKSRIADAYTAISNKGGTLPAQQTAANLPTAIASIPSGGGLPTDGSTFVTGADEGSFATPFAINGITHLIDNSTTAITRNHFMNYMTSLQIVEMNEVTYISLTSPYSIFGNTQVQQFRLPKCTATGQYDRRYGMFGFNQYIKEIEWGVMVWERIGSYTFNSPFGITGIGPGLYTDNLIDFKIAQGWSTAANCSLNLSTWRANNITSADDLATLNSNIVNHLVNTYGGTGTTITLLSSFVAKLTQDTLDAFAAKGLTIAAV